MSGRRANGLAEFHVFFDRSVRAETRGRGNGRPNRYTDTHVDTYITIIHSHTHSPFEESFFGTTCIFTDYEWAVTLSSSSTSYPHDISSLFLSLSPCLCL